MKKRFIAIVLITIFMGGLLMTSCKKYDEDYGLMLKTPKARLAGKWAVTEIGSGSDFLKVSDYSAIGTLYVTFAKDETGTIKFESSVLSTYLSGLDLSNIDLSEYDVDITGMSSIDMDEISKLLTAEYKFKWEFSDDKEKLYFQYFDETANTYTEKTEVEILSLCTSDCKFAYVEDGEQMIVSMQK